MEGGMNKKDITEKNLEEYNDVFADILNGVIFRGEQVVKEDELIDQPTRSSYRAKGENHEQFRDIAKIWKQMNIRIAFFGLENQTGIDPAMPLRILNYDAAVYRGQIRKEKKKNQELSKFYPVITLVIYFGEKPWDGPRSLSDCLDIPAGLADFVSDYQIHVVDIYRLSEEELDRFHSDFEIIAKFLNGMRKDVNYKGPEKVITHTEETLDLISAITGDARFTEYTDVTEGGEHKMCTYIDQLLEKGRNQGKAEGKIEGKAEGMAEGMAEGIAKGIAKEKQNIISRMLTINPIENVVKFGGFSYDEVKLVYDNMIREDKAPYGA